MLLLIDLLLELLFFVDFTLLWILVHTKAFRWNYHYCGNLRNINNRYSSTHSSVRWWQRRWILHPAFNSIEDEIEDANQQCQNDVSILVQYYSNNKNNKKNNNNKNYNKNNNNNKNKGSNEYELVTNRHFQKDETVIVSKPTQLQPTPPNNDTTNSTTSTTSTTEQHSHSI